MPFHPYGPVQDLSVIDETNAYCWVDIVVDNADAWVRFEGDGASNLADPSFAAKAGETNHVVILIGKTYKVTCDMPFTVVAKSDPSIGERWSDDNTLWLNWPVNIWARGDDEDMPLLLMGTGTGMGGGNGFTMHVVPNCLGGEFSWTNSCCSVSGSGIHFSYSCDGHCFCTGCSAKGSKGGNWSHTANDGAGGWHTVLSSGYVMTDKAGRRSAYEIPWSAGWKEWAVPMEWGEGGAISVSFSPNTTTQRFELQSNGHFTIRKHGHYAERNVLGLKWCDGEFVW